MSQSREKKSPRKDFFKNRGLLERTLTGAGLLSAGIAGLLGAENSADAQSICNDSRAAYIQIQGGNAQQDKKAGAEYDALCGRKASDSKPKSAPKPKAKLPAEAPETPTVKKTSETAQSANIIEIKNLETELLQLKTDIQKGLVTKEDGQVKVMEICNLVFDEKIEASKEEMIKKCEEKHKETNSTAWQILMWLITYILPAGGGLGIGLHVREKKHRKMLAQAALRTERKD